MKLDNSKWPFGRTGFLNKKMKMKTKCYLIGATIGIAAVLFAGESLNPLFAMFGKEVQVS